MKIIFECNNGRCSSNLSRTIFLSNLFVGMFLNLFHLILDWIFSNMSRWVLTFNNQLTSTSTYLISHQKMSIRLNSFLQCSYSNKSRHLQSNLSISFFHSFSYSSDGFPKHNLFFINKPFRSNSNDLHISRNTEHNMEKCFE